MSRMYHFEIQSFCVLSSFPQNELEGDELSAAHSIFGNKWTRKLNCKKCSCCSKNRNRSCTAGKGLRFISNLNSNIFALKAVSRTVVQVMCAYLVEKQKSRQIFQTERSKFSQIEGIESLKAFIKDSPFTPFPPSSRPGNKEVTLAVSCTFQPGYDFL